MDIVFKPTAKCNFKCKFCSYSNSKDNSIADIAVLDSLIKENDVHQVFINGGEPLVLPPEYYLPVIEKYPEIEFDFTTNLALFVLNPDKWKDLFLRKNVSVSTSFQFGDLRQHKNLVDGTYTYTESQFRKTIDIFYEKIGYHPCFISVIDNSNYKYAIDNVRLAKALNTKCKLNPCQYTGKAKMQFNTGLMYQIYLDVIDQGLENYEINLCERNRWACPRARKQCMFHIRTLENHNKLHTCCTFQCENDYSLVTEENPNGRLEELFRFKTLKPECKMCPLHNLCNGCFYQIYGALKDENYDIELQCNLMKKNKDRLLEVFNAKQFI